MSTRLVAALEGALEDRRARGLERIARPPSGVDFSSNDYLGYSAIAETIDATAGLPASRLLGGTRPEHIALEAELAAWKGHEAGLLFPSGYQANLTLLPAVIGPRDRVLSDALNHASIIDGLRLARPAEKHVFPHLHAGEVDRILATPFSGRTFLVTESLFSMDGDRAPLDEYAELCATHGAELIVDDAHATGLYGERAQGLSPPTATATISTFGKSLASTGAVLTGPSAVVSWVIQTGRGFVYSTATSTVAAAQLRARLGRLGTEPGRGARAIALAEELRVRLRAAGLDVRGADSPIVPVVLGSIERTVTAADRVAARGFDVRAVRPPTVPAETSRLRISVHANHEEAQLVALAAAIVEGARW